MTFESKKKLFFFIFFVSTCIFTLMYRKYMDIDFANKFKWYIEDHKQCEHVNQDSTFFINLFV